VQQRKKIGEMLVEAGVLDRDALTSALGEQRRWGGSLGRILVDMRLITEGNLVACLGKQLGIPSIDLDKLDVAQELIDLIPTELALRHQIIPFGKQMKFLDVAMSEPTNLGIIDELRIRTQLNIRSYLAGPKMIARALQRYYGSVAAGTTGYGRAITLEGYTRDGQRGTSLKRAERDAEIVALQDRVALLEAQVSRDEDVLRKLLGLLVDKQVATREEILDKIR
jgi:hypothetical protein